MRAEPLKGHLDGMILAFIGEAPAHGYALIESLKERSGGPFALPERTVYPALHRLETEELLVSAWVDASGRRRRVYRLTERGRVALTERRAEWRTFSSAVDGALA